MTVSRLGGTLFAKAHARRTPASSAEEHEIVDKKDSAIEMRRR
jgi:hypothetical protein